MKKIYPAFILFFILCKGAVAQIGFVKQWDSMFGGRDDDWLSAICETTDAGYLLGGVSASGIGGNKTTTCIGEVDYWVVKIDSLGIKQWERRFGGSEADGLTCLQQTRDGGYILGGSSWSMADGNKTQPNWDTSRVSSDYWVVKINAIGIKQWDKRFGGIGDDRMYSVQQTSDGGYVLGGYSTSDIGGDKTQASRDTSSQPLARGDYWIIKTDSLGNKQWDKRYGGEFVEELSSVKQTTDGGYVLGGSSSSSISGDRTQANWDTFTSIPSTSSDFWIVKTDAAGNKLWDKRFGGDKEDDPRSMQQTADGGYILGGTSRSGVSGDKTQPNWDIYYSNVDYWVVKIDAYGNKEWDKRYGGTLDDKLSNISQTPDHGYLVSGMSFSNNWNDKSELNLGFGQGWVLKIDWKGTKQWDKTMFTSGTDQGLSLALQTKDGCFLFANSSNGGIAGYKTQVPWGPFGQVDYWVLKFCDTIFRASSVPRNPICIIPCSGSAASYPSNGTPPYSYFWQPGNDTTAAISNLCPGTYIITVTDANGLSVSNIVTVGNPVQPTASINANYTLICPGDSAQICASYGFSNYEWNNSATTSCIITGLSGIYSVTVTDNNGCSAESNHLTINAYTIPSVNVGVDVSIICANGSAHLCADTGFAHYLWNNSSTTKCTSASLAGNYYVTVTDNNGCTAESNHLSLSVYPSPSVSLSVNGDTLTAYNAVAYQWYLNGSAISGETDGIYIAIQSGSYTVMATDTNGCTATSSPVIISGIDNVTVDDVVSVFPNPSQNTWQLTVGNNLLGGIAEVFDANGRVVFKSEIRNSQSEIAPEVSRGIYLLRISSSKSSVVRKLIRL